MGIWAGALLVLATTAGTALAQNIPGTDAMMDDAPAGAPKGTSAGAGEARYDAVLMARAGDTGTVPALLHPTLAAGSVVEVTALDSGRTVLLEIARGEAGDPVLLSPSAASALGIAPDQSVGVRIRPVNATGQDMAALRQGIAPQRLDAPAALLVGLRKRLPTAARVAAARPAVQPAANPDKPTPPASAPLTFTPKPFVPATPPPAKPQSSAPVAVPTPAAASTATGSLFVQVGAFSSRARADALAAQLKGRVVPGTSIHRVQIGPFADQAAAGKARADVASRGFPDARIVQNR
ncbi:SPOR domain-containing protein [Sphingomonas sp. CJ99]